MTFQKKITFKSVDDLQTVGQDDEIEENIFDCADERLNELKYMKRSHEDGQFEDFWIEEKRQALYCHGGCFNENPYKDKPLIGSIILK